MLNVIRESIQEMKVFVLNPEGSVRKIVKVKKALQPEGRFVEIKRNWIYRELKESRYR